MTVVPLRLRKHEWTTMCRTRRHCRSHVTPERAVVIEHRDPLGERDVAAPPSSVTRPTKSTIACRVGVSFQDFQVLCHRPGSVAREGRPGLLCQVDEGWPLTSTDGPVDGAADERPRVLARVVVGDRLGALLADVEPFAGDRELAWLGPDPALADLGLVPYMEGQRAFGRHRVAFALERRREHHVPGRNRLGRLDDLLDEADPVVDVFQLAILDVQRVPTEAGAVGEQDPRGLLGIDDLTSTPIV